MSEHESNDDEIAKIEIIHQDFDNLDLDLPKYLLDIGETNIARDMAMRISTRLEKYAIPIAAQISAIEDIPPDAEAVFNTPLFKTIERYSHDIPHVAEKIRRTGFRGVAFDALRKLDSICRAERSDDWLCYINDPESFLYDPVLYDELTVRFPKSVKYIRYNTLYKERSFDQLLIEFPEQITKVRDHLSADCFKPPIAYHSEVHRNISENHELYFSNLRWFAEKIVECHRICQMDPEYLHAQTDEIMVGIRALIQKLMAEPI